MNIEITGQGTQLYPHKSYHTGVTVATKCKIENGALVHFDIYKLNVGEQNYVPMGQAVQIQSIPAHVNIDGIKIAQDMVFNGKTGNAYRAHNVYQSGNTHGMLKADAMVFADWYNQFGQQFGY